MLREEKPEDQLKGEIVGKDESRKAVNWQKKYIVAIYSQIKWIEASNLECHYNYKTCKLNEI